MKTLDELKAYAQVLGAQVVYDSNAEELTKSYSTQIIVQMPAQRRQIQGGHAGDGRYFPVTNSLQQNVDLAYKFMKDWEELWALKNDVAKKEIKTYIQKRLHEDKQAIRTLMLIFSRQTSTEQQAEATTLHNNVGFTGVDAKILSSFAKQLETRNFLSPKQMVILKKKMCKYWEQVIDATIQKGNELILLKQVKAARPAPQPLQTKLELI